jgi:predicted nucleotidyltransferase
MGVGLNDLHRKMVVDLLNHYIPNTRVWIYGSRAKGTARPASDLDMIAFTQPDQTLQVSALKEAFEESNLPFRVDLFVWDEVPDTFRKTIEEDHQILI